MRVRPERCTSPSRSARTLTQPLSRRERGSLTVPSGNPSPSGRRWRQPDEGPAGAMHITLALRPHPHPAPLPEGEGITHRSKWEPFSLPEKVAAAG